MKSKLVYVASPLTVGDPFRNLARAMDAGDVLSDRGYVPLIPHLSAYRHVRRPRPYEDWMWEDFALLARCDALWRLSGTSPGADREVLEAQRLGIPVVFSVQALGEIFSEA